MKRDEAKKWCRYATVFEDHIDQIFNDHEAQLKAKDEEIEGLKEAMQEFVNRCEKGEVRSKYTYSKFKELLKEQQ